jgi:hypothetical protein
MDDQPVLKNPNEFFPTFFSFTDTDDEWPDELHYVVFGENGPVQELRVYPDGETEIIRTTFWDMFMEDREMGLGRVTWEESAWSDHFKRE